MTFVDELWTEVAPRYEAILAHPFLTGLLDGTLPTEAFQHYVLQDAHYLRDYARALAVTGAKATDDESIVGFCQDAAGAILVERSLHEGFIRDFETTDSATAGADVLPTTLAYTSYLLRTAHQGDFAEAVAVALPCYWIYARVGEELLARSRVRPSPDARYQKWIETYGGAEFQATVARVLATVDQLGKHLSPTQRGRFAEHVVATTRYEWLFFDAAWRGERWPPVLD